MGVGVAGPQAWAPGLPSSTVSSQGLKPPASGSVDTYVKANLLPGASKVRGTPRPLGHTPHLEFPPCSSAQSLDFSHGDPHCWDVQLGPWQGGGSG